MKLVIGMKPVKRKTVSLKMLKLKGKENLLRKYGRIPISRIRSKTRRESGRRKEETTTITVARAKNIAKTNQRAVNRGVIKTGAVMNIVKATKVSTLASHQSMITSAKLKMVQKRLVNTKQRRVSWILRNSKVPIKHFTLVSLYE